MTEAAPLDVRALWAGAIPYERFVQESEQNRPLWEGIYRTANIPEWAIADACREAARVRILAIVEDWLQAWVMLYPQVRRWYAKDRGTTTLREVLGLLPRLLPQNVHCE